ncbi:MAG: hypothetical protein D6798_08880, partial [Deltaproteobacteria bacterium]
MARQTATVDRAEIVVERLALVGLVSLGAAVRLGYGLMVRPWLASPGQQAWALLLAEASREGLRADQLILSPAEPGSVVTGLLALVLQPLAGPGLPALSLAALVVDTGARLVQVLAAHHLFGPRSALSLALWQIVALPMLLAMGTVGTGPDAFAGTWPFLLLAVLHGGESGRLSARRAAAVGAIAGLSLAWSTGHVSLVVTLPV